MGCTCTSKCFRAALGIVFGIGGTIGALYSCSAYNSKLDGYNDSDDFITAILKGFNIIYTAEMVLACIGMVYTVVKSDTKYVKYIMRLFIIAMVCNLGSFLTEVMISYQENIDDIIYLLFNMLKFYIISIIRDDIHLNQTQYPAVDYDTQEPPQYSQATAYGDQFNQQYPMQQFPAPGTQIYSQMPQMQPNIQAGYPMYPIYPMYPQIQQQYQQPSAPTNLSTNPVNYTDSTTALEMAANISDVIKQ